MKCRAQREMRDPQPLFNARGAAYTRGVCPVCGTALLRFGKGELHGEAPARAAQLALPEAGADGQESETNGENTPAAKAEGARQETTATPKALPKRPPKAENEEGKGARAKRVSPAEAGVDGKGTRVKSPPQGVKRKAKGKAKGAAKPTRRTARAPRTGTELEEIGASKGVGKRLVIVESPAKARTVGRFLGREFIVRASIGHVRDLPEKQLGVDIEHEFKPHYVITPKKKSTVQELKGYAQGATDVLLATDPDREGEAIAWHLTQALGPSLKSKRVQRIEFHEITQEAVSNALAHPREIDLPRVDSQQARRILDRIVGYKISPLLRKKMGRKGLSAGRVQSVALLLVVLREREIASFVPVEYWSIEAELAKRDAPPDAPEAQPFRARLVKVGAEEFECHAGAEALELKARLETCSYRVLEVRRKDVFRNPAAPFITSTLQQEASRKLGFNPKRTMTAAQQLYEGIAVGEEGSVGLITYMRTDSTQVAESAKQEAAAFILERFGQAFMPQKPRQYSKQVAGAQLAHEAIRPTRVFREPGGIRSYLSSDQFRLYELIWKRFLASQMASAIFDTTAVDIGADLPNRPDGGGTRPDFLFRANGSLVKFEGFLRVYAEGRDEKGETEEGGRLPPLTAEEWLRLLGIIPEQHFTEPPPRYTEATLIKALEQHGIGRPSTYAAILGNIQERGYIEQIENRRLRPNELGFVLSDLLAGSFGEIINVGFTAQMEERLDEIAAGGIPWGKVLHDFYGPFAATLERAEREMPATKLEDEKTDQVCPECGGAMVVKRGRFGKFLACSTWPKCRHTEPLTSGVVCPECGKGKLAAKRTKRGRTFFGCSRYPECKFATWDEPLAVPCPRCGGLLTAKGEAVKCVRGDFVGKRAELTGAASPVLNPGS